jgi:elongation factor G
MAYTTEAIRNIALIGHAGSGKTTLTEALLLKAGRINSAGSVDKGNTVCDYDPLEKSHQHSLETAMVSLDHQDTHINILDTPGFPEFTGHSIAALSAVETAAIVINAQTGIETVTHRMMAQAGERDLCRMIIINKVDSDNIDLPILVEQIQETFGSECLPINLPAGNGSRVIDCFFNSEGDETDFSSVEEAHTAIIDQVIEMDEDLMELYLEQDQDIDAERLHDTFERALREGHLIPICFVSAQADVGIDQLLNIFARLLPSPLEGNITSFRTGDGEDSEEITPSLDAGDHVIAHVFKVSIDPFVGRIALFRIHQGTITKDSQLYIGDARKPFKVNHLLQVFGKEHSDVPQGIPGDICAVSKVDDIHRGSVLHDSHDEDNLNLIPLRYPTPLFGLAINVQKRGDEQKLSETLQKLAEEDPCLAIEHNQSTAQTVLRGMSDLHLRIAMEKMNERYNLEVNTEPPKIPYRETISVAAEGHHRHKKQTGGAGQFGEVFLRIEPLEQGSGFEFASAVVGGSIPTSLIPAVEKGIREALPQGAIAGFPLHDIRAIATDGKHHPVDSKEIAFSTAGREAFLDAVRKAKPQVLEPIVKIHVQAPADAMGAIAGDLSSRRGRVNGSETTAGGTINVEGVVPLAELGNYQSHLTSVTGGAGSYDLEFSHYEPVPGDIQKKLCEEFQNQRQSQE